MKENEAALQCVVDIPLSIIPELLKVSRKSENGEIFWNAHHTTEKFRNSGSEIKYNGNSQ